MSIMLDQVSQIDKNNYQKNFAKENLQVNESYQFFMKVVEVTILQLLSSIHLISHFLPIFHSHIFSQYSKNMT